MEASLGLTSHDHSALLQKVPVNVGAGNAAVGREADPNELSKPTGVVVPLRLRVAEGLKDRVRLKNLPLE